MNGKILGIPKIIVGFLIVIIVPLLFGEYLLYQKFVDESLKTEELCKARVIVQKEPLVTPTLTATPSPTLKPRVYVPVVTQPVTTP